MGFFGNLDNINNSFTQDTLTRGLSQLLPVRVISIDQSNSLNNGTIVGEIILQQSQQPYRSRITAYPINSNTKNYPLINEVVFVVAGPTGKYSNNSSEVKYYYLTTLNLWNNVNTNPTPNPYTNLSPNSQTKTISEIEIGSPNKSGENNTNSFKPGTYFTEKENIFPLYPFEGDYIIEGRFGNSIRFGSTDIKYNTKYKSQLKNKSYSTSQTFSPGDITLTNKLLSDLSVINSQIRAFNEQYSNVNVNILITGGESQIPNPSNLAIGLLALKRAQQVQTTLSSYIFLKDNIKIDTIIGETPYVVGINNINDPLYLKEQFVSINISVSGTEYILQDTSPQILNNWSNVPKNGDPITIIRNGQSSLLSGSAQSTVVEDINNDISSIWMGSTQQIPIKVSSQNNYLSYGENPPISPLQFSGSQIVLNSGRLVFNTKTDHLMLSSQKSINLNAQESINFDTTGNTVFQSNKVYLGGTKNSQPVILGDEMVNLLTDVLSDLNFLCGQISNQLGVPTGAPLEPLASSARIVKSKIGGYKTRLKNSLSSTTKTV